MSAALSNAAPEQRRIKRTRATDRLEAIYLDAFQLRAMIPIAISQVAASSSISEWFPNESVAARKTSGCIAIQITDSGGCVVGVGSRLD